MLIAAAAAMILSAACTKEAIHELNPSLDGKKTVEFKVQLDDAGTKAWLDGLSVRWTNGDKVAVFDGVSEEPNEFIVSGANGKSAVIGGTVAEAATEFVAVYPYSAAKSRTAKGVSISIGQYQAIPQGKTVDPKALISVAQSSGGIMTFRNVVSLVAFDINSNDVKSVTFYGNTEELITGAAEVDMSGSDPVSAATGSSYVSVSTEGGNVFSQGRYYAVVMPAELSSGVSLAVSTSSAKYIHRSGNPAVLPINGGKYFGGVEGGTKLPMIISSKADLVTWADNITAYVRGDVVKLSADIDFGGKEWTPLPGRCSLDGQGHSIYNFVINTSKHPDLDRFGLFQTLNDDNVIKDIKLGCAPGGQYDGVSSITIDSASDNYYVGALAGVVKNNKGSDKISISNVWSYIPTTLALPSAETMTLRVGGIAGYITTGEPVILSNCRNYGDLKNASGVKMTGNLYLGGMTGNLSCANSTIENCSNYAEVNLSSKSNGLINSSFAGGIVGRIASIDGVTINGCHNEGKITVGINIKVAHYIGGIVGMDHQPVESSSYNVEISECTNAGEVGASAQSKSGYYGGIIGFTESKALISDCDNLEEGAIFKKNNHSSESAYGGIIGKAAGCEGALVAGCSNAAPLTESGTVSNATEVYHAFGGIAGIGNIDIVNCSNSGAITVAYSANTTLHCAGGIAGLHEGFKMSGCSNTGSITSTLNCPTGGLIGLQLDAALSTGEGCSVACDIKPGEAPTGGMLIGKYSGTSSITFGSSASPISVSGSFNGGAVGKNCLCGSASASLPVFHVNF